MKTTINLIIFFLAKVIYNLNIVAAAVKERDWFIFGGQ